MADPDPDRSDDGTIPYIMMDLDNALLLIDLAHHSGGGVNYDRAHWTYDVILWRSGTLRTSEEKLSQVKEKLAALRARLEAVGHEF